MRHRLNPSHRYADETLSDLEIAKLAQNIYAVMRSAFKNFPIPSRSEVVNWLTGPDALKYLFTYSDLGTEDKLGPLKAFIYAERFSEPKYVFEALGFDTSSQSMEDLFDYLPISSSEKSKLSKFIDLIESIYSHNKYVLDVSYFAAVSDDGESAQQDYSARVFLPFMRQVVLKEDERPIIWGHMREGSYRLFDDARLRKAKYTKVFEEGSFIIGEEVIGVVLFPNEYIENARVDVESVEQCISAVMQLANIVG